MSAAALGLALGAALLHALWNVLLAGSRDSVASAGAVLVFGAVLLAPAALLFGGGVSAGAIPLVAASAALQLAYLVLGAAALGLGKGVSVPAAVGVVLVAAGVLLVGARRVSPRNPRETRHAPPDLLFGMAIGVTIAGYTLVDSEGLDHADPLPYLFLIAAVCAAAYTGGLLATGHARALRRAPGRRAPPPPPPPLRA